mmetsp:Transcript_29723/g.64244  ORF Transcript_29723/g.64244 Transcript_29723/m.64244 type:complete len:219 (+) Transcript_29723:1622-2278(+)
MLCIAIQCGRCCEPTVSSDVECDVATKWHTAICLLERDIVDVSSEERTSGRKHHLEEFVSLLSRVSMMRLSVVRLTGCHTDVADVKEACDVLLCARHQHSVVGNNGVLWVYGEDETFTLCSEATVGETMHREHRNVPLQLKLGVDLFFVGLVPATSNMAVSGDICGRCARPRRSRRPRCSRRPRRSWRALPKPVFLRRVRPCDGDDALAIESQHRGEL